MIRQLMFIGCVGVLVAGCARHQGAAPAWELTAVDGRTVRSADFAGQVVILDFWATWCPPCRKAVPDLIQLQKEYGPRGLTVIGVSLDQEGVEVVREFMNEFQINYPVVMGDESVTAAFGGIRGIPTVFVIDRQGQIVDKHVGYTPRATFEKRIKPLL